MQSAHGDPPVAQGHPFRLEPGPLIGLDAGNEPALTVHHPPPGIPIVVAQEAADGSCRPGVPSLSSHLAVARDVTRGDALQHPRHVALEVGEVGLGGHASEEMSRTTSSGSAMPGSERRPIGSALVLTMSDDMTSA